MSSASPAGTADLKKLSLDEKLAFFYCTYVREESIDPEVDLDAVKRWERISVSSSKRKRQGRVSFLLQQIENVSTSKVRHLDANYKAKRELILLAEGTIGNISKNGSSGRSGSSARGRSSSSGAKGGNDASRAQRETARLNNEIFQECGALPIFTQELLKSLNAFKMLNSQQMDVDQVESMIQDLHKDMTLMYLLIVFNANQVTKTCFDRHLAFLGSTHPCQALVAMLDCLTQMNVLPGFPIKRLLLLFYEWFSAVFGDTEMLDGLKKIRRDHHLSQQEKKIYTIRDLDDPMRCKVYTPFQDVVFLDPQDPYYLQKKKFTNIRRKIHEKYYHQPHAELKCKISNEKELAQSKLSLLDDEWEANIEQVYQLLLPRMREYTSLFSNLMSISCGSALNAREKQTFFSRKPSTTENSNQFAEYSSSPQQYMAAQNLAGGPDNPQGDSQYWRWILREKAIVLDVVNLLILLMGKHFRASHVLKGEYYFQFFVEANVPATLTKFMNKDLSTYLQVSGRQGATGSVVAMEDVQHLQSIRPVGFYALENDFEKLSIRTEDDYNEYSIQSTRTITSSLRILQKLSNKKPNIIKNALCRSSSIVWLKRVVSLQIPLPRLYALKLVKSQAKYLGHQWLRKFTCVHLLTEIYLHVRPTLDDDWLQYEEDDPSKPPANQDAYERLLFGEIQSYHHRHYWDAISRTKKEKNVPSSSPSSNSMLVMEARKELDDPKLELDGGPICRFYNDLKLDSVHFCQQYEKWLDQEGITSSPNLNETLPLSF